MPKTQKEFSFHHLTGYFIAGVSCYKEHRKMSRILKRIYFSSLDGLFIAREFHHTLLLLGKKSLSLRCQGLRVLSNILFTKVFFAFVLNRKCGSFQCKWTKRTSLISCVVMELHNSWCIPHTIQVWGIVSFILAWVFPQPSIW